MLDIEFWLAYANFAICNYDFRNHELGNGVRVSPWRQDKMAHAVVFALCDQIVLDQTWGRQHWYRYQ